VTLLRIVTENGVSYGTGLDAAHALAYGEERRERVEVYLGDEFVAYAPTFDARAEMVERMEANGHTVRS